MNEPNWDLMQTGEMNLCGTKVEKSEYKNKMWAHEET